MPEPFIDRIGAPVDSRRQLIPSHLSEHQRVHPALAVRFEDDLGVHDPGEKLGCAFRIDIDRLLACELRIDPFSFARYLDRHVRRKFIFACISVQNFGIEGNLGAFPERLQHGGIGRQKWRIRVQEVKSQVVDTAPA